MKKVVLILAATTILFVGYILVRASFHNLPLGLPEVVGDANPVLRTERKFNDSVSVVKRNETISTIGSKWKNYYWNGERLDIDTTLVQTSDGFCADKMPFKFCAPLRSPGEAIFTANNQYDIFGNKVITDAPLEERMTAVGVSDVAGQLIVGDLMMSNGKYEDVQYVLYPGAYNDADLIYYVNYGRAPRLAQLVRWNIQPTCTLPLTRTFISKYSAPVEIVNFETKVKWNKTGQLQLAGEPLRIAASENRGIGKKPFKIWDSNEDPKLLYPKTQRIDVKIINAPGQNAYALTKILPCDFFTNKVYPIYTDTVSTFNPDPDPEGQSVDGFVIFDGATAEGIAWSTIRGNNGNLNLDAVATWRTGYTEAEGANTFDSLWRGAMAFETGDVIGTNETVTACDLDLVPNSITNGLGNSPDFVVTNTTGTFTTDLADADYQTHGNTEYSDRIDLGAFAVGVAEKFTCTTDGINAIAKGTGNLTRFFLKTHFDLADSPVPNINNPGTQQSDNIFFDSAESANDPVLTVTHAEAAAGEDEGSIIEFMYWKLYDIKVATYYSLTDFISTAYAKVRGD